MIRNICFRLRAFGLIGPGLLAVSWLLLLGCPAAAADRIHTVQRGETLTGIARRYDTTLSKLAEANRLSRTAQVQVGQRLKIPGPPTPTPSSSSSQDNASAKPGFLSASLQNAIDKAPVKAGRWRYIVIHHSGVDTGTLKGMDEYHRRVRRMENGLAYHFVIGNGSGMSDGLIAASHRWTRQLDGGHLASESQNARALGICLVGNFDQHRPTARQMESLRALVLTLLRRCDLPVSAVKVHREINVIGTRCPGSRFPTKTFMTSLKSGRKTR